jgi:hypothetical protein
VNLTSPLESSTWPFPSPYSNTATSRTRCRNNPNICCSANAARATPCQPIPATTTPSGVIPPFQLLPTATDDAESSSSLDDASVTPYQPTSQILPSDEGIPISPSGGAESPPELSHTFTFYRSNGAYALRSHIVWSGPNCPDLTNPAPPTFHHNENEFARVLADSKWREQQDQARPSQGSAVAMQEASAAGVAQCDFALEIPEGLEDTRGSLAHNTQDPEGPIWVDFY